MCAMRCLNCGTENAADAKFCVGCGKSLRQRNFSAKEENGRETYSGTGFCEIGKTERGNPSSMAQAEVSSGGSSSVLPRRIAFAVVGFIIVVAAVNIIQSLVGNGKQQSSDDSQESSSYYSSQKWDGVIDGNSNGSGDTSGQSGIDSSYGNAGDNNTNYTYACDEEDDKEDTYDEEDAYDEEDTYDVDVSEYIFPDSETRKLTKADLRNKTSEELRLGRNEIYARHGRLFDDKELQEYFDEQSWYFGTIDPSDFVDSLELNDIERRNAKFILKYENSKRN